MTREFKNRWTLPGDEAKTNVPAISVSYTHLDVYKRQVYTYVRTHLNSLHEGLRWPDIKRYGIVIYRRSIANNNIVVTDEMPVNDARREMCIRDRL